MAVRGPRPDGRVRGVLKGWVCSGAKDIGGRAYPGDRATTVRQIILSAWTPISVLASTGDNLQNSRLKALLHFCFSACP